ncbi:hypothetical protein CFREI_01995 [Corynebacterium freiburgense]|nr:hypothetical protein CFREI_01995 [Corynebacterium freiburgense]
MAGQGGTGWYMVGQVAGLFGRWFGCVLVVWLCACGELGFGRGWVGSGREVLGLLGAGWALVGRWLGAG